MPQWKRDRAADIASGQDERWIAECSATDADLLADYDHHVIRVEGRRGVLITYHFRGSRQSTQRPHLQVSFAHPDGHPDAPATVQAIVDLLAFRPWDGSTPDAL